MNVTLAVQIAKKHILDLFEEEKLTNLGLEEVEFDNATKEWVVTAGFSRPWDEPRSSLSTLSQSASAPLRSYKVVRINDNSQQVTSVKNRVVPH